MGKLSPTTLSPVPCCSLLHTSPGDPKNEPRVEPETQPIGDHDHIIRCSMFLTGYLKYVFEIPIPDVFLPVGKMPVVISLTPINP